MCGLVAMGSFDRATQINAHLTLFGLGCGVPFLFLGSRAWGGAIAMGADLFGGWTTAVVAAVDAGASEVTSPSYDITKTQHQDTESSIGHEEDA